MFAVRNEKNPRRSVWLVSSHPRVVRLDGRCTLQNLRQRRNKGTVSNGRTYAIRIRLHKSLVEATPV
jgi:hypothetical protein